MPFLLVSQILTITNPKLTDNTIVELLHKLTVHCIRYTEGLVLDCEAGELNRVTSYDS